MPGCCGMCQPARFGGYEMGWDVLCDLADVLAAADGSQAWLQHIYRRPHRAGRDFPGAGAGRSLGQEPQHHHVGLVRSRSAAPTRVEGGFLYSGRHGFSSGIDYASWLICGGFIAENEGLDGPHFFLVPKSDVEVLDDWQTMALEGTGSKSFRRHRQVHPGASLPRRPAVALRHRAGHRGQQGGGLSHAAVRRRGGGGILGARGRHGARRARGMARADRAAHARAASPSARSRARRSLPPAPPPRSTPRTRSTRSTVRGGMRKLEEGGTLKADAERLTGRRNIAFACPACAQGRHAAVQCRRRPRALPEGRDAAAIPQPARRDGASRRGLGSRAPSSMAPRCSSSTARRGPGRLVELQTNQRK